MELKVEIKPCVATINDKLTGEPVEVHYNACFVTIGSSKFVVNPKDEFKPWFKACMKDYMNEKANTKED